MDWVFVFVAALFFAHLEVKLRIQQHENDAQTRKGDEDDAS
ncbi:hypothetical protein [Ensifer sp. ENS10]|nr:hypothetical protein [Ensifer sp. ENS10]